MGAGEGWVALYSSSPCHLEHIRFISSSSFESGEELLRWVAEKQARQLKKRAAGRKLDHGLWKNAVGNKRSSQGAPDFGVVGVKEDLLELFLSQFLSSPVAGDQVLTGHDGAVFHENSTADSAGVLGMSQ